MHRRFICLALLISLLSYSQVKAQSHIIESRRELFVDSHLIDKLGGQARLKLNHPARKNIAIVHDAPWEGSGGGYHTVFFDPKYKGGMYRMYYHAWHIPLQGEQGAPLTIAYAESKDGIRFKKPKLGIASFKGSKANNIILDKINDRRPHDFNPFIDANPNAAADAPYKAVGRAANPTGLYAFKSKDGIHWQAYSNSKPVMTGHPFDTQNIVFWDPNIKKYRAYIRDFIGPRRIIKTATSDDFIHWTKRVPLKFVDSPKQQLYTNQVKPYYRAPHLLLGFPARYVDRGWTPATRALPSLRLRKLRATTSRRFGTAVTDAMFMVSRDGLTFKRWNEAFIRPGLRTKHNWAYGDNYMAWHVVETNSVDDDSPRELSIYATESYFTGKSSRLRRYTMRLDGFASLHAPGKGGECVTKPLVMKGSALHLNLSTSAAGSVHVELQSADGKPLPGYSLKECSVIFGDFLSYKVQWAKGTDVSKLAGKPIRIRLVLKDADVFSYRFK